MKPIPLLAVVALALGLGFFAGKQSGTRLKIPEGTASPVRETARSARTPRTDPFGGNAFSLHSMEDIRALFRDQRPAIASARLTLSIESLSAKEIPAIMEMVQEDFRSNPNQYDQERTALMSTLFGKWTASDPAAALAFVHSCKQRSFRNYAAQECFAGLTQADPTRAIAELRLLPKGELREAAAPRVIQVLGKTDPAAACDLLVGEPSRSGFSDYYSREIFSNWAKTDPAAAAARLSSLPDEMAGGYSASALANTWAKTDSQAALSWAKTLKGDRKSLAMVEVYSALAREDPAAAWDELKGEAGHLRGKLSGGILKVVADEDPDKAVSMLKHMDSPAERRIATAELIDQFSWGETRLAFDLVHQVDDATTRREQLGNLMYYAAWSSGDLLKEQTAKLTDRERIETASQVLNGLVRTDPTAARAYFLALPETQRGTNALSNLMTQYASKDPKGAFEFATSLTNPQEKTSAITGLFSAWGREDPEAAADGLKKLPAGETRLGALDNIASSWAASDPDAARKWADGLPGAERVRALAAVLPALAKDDPATAGIQLAGLLNAPPDGMAKNLATSAGTLASTWASNDPSAAAKWAASLPAGQGQDSSIGAVARSWSQYDAVAAADWIQTLPSGSARDAAVKPLVNRVRQTDPATAFSWASTIEDPADRIGQLGETLKSWRGTNLSAARAALDAADLTPEERIKLDKELE